MNDKEEKMKTEKILLKHKIKKKRRVKRIRKQINNFRILYSNINGIKSKIESLEDIIEEEKPTVIAVVETKLAQMGDFDIPGYKTLMMNRDENGGGLMISVKDELKNIVVECEEKNEVGEAKWILIDNGRNKIRLGLLYAPQENKTSKKQLKVMYKELQEQVERARANKQEIILLGDFNCKVGNIISGNHEEVSKGGKILLNMVEKLDLKLINSSEICNGVWTRKDGNKKSVLDYVLMEREGEKLVTMMKIDEERNCTPYRIVEGRKIYTDHNTITIDINWSMRYQPGEHKIIAINNKTNEEFRRRTENSNFTNIVTKEDGIQNKYSQWSEEILKVASEVYVKKKKKKRVDMEVKILQKKRKLIRNQIKRTKPEEEEVKINLIRRKLIDEHIVNIKKERVKQKTTKLAQQIKKENGFDGGVFWEFKRRKEGRKAEARLSVKDKRGEVVEKVEDIKEVYRSFYEDLLKEKEMTEGGEEIEEVVNKYIETMERISERQTIKAFSEVELEDVCQELNKRKAPDKQGWRYEMILNAGNDLKDSILQMINQVVMKKLVPIEWKEMIIKSISKGKGDLRTMDSRRGLFLTNIISKVVEKLFKNRNKKRIDSNLSPFQCGGVKNRGIVDNLLIVNSMIAEHKGNKKDGYLMFADLEKCFDKLWLRDCIKEVCEAGMPITEAVYLMKMNQDITAVVETPFGMTESFQVKEIVRQGTIWGPQLCGVSTDRINKMKGDDLIKTVSGVEVKSPVFVDDMNGMGDGKEIENMGRKMAVLEITKKFSFNNLCGKTEILPLTFKKRKKGNVENVPVVTVKKGQVLKTEEYKYVGDWYDGKGSNLTKIKRKMKKSNHVITEVKKVSRYEMVGEADVEVRMLLLEMIVKPTLLFNTETWIDLKQKDIKEIEKHHYQIIRKAFEQKQGTPYYGIIAETGIWPYYYTIIYKRLMLYHHLIHSDEKRIARQLVINQKERNEVNWYTGVKEWLNILKMETDVNKIIGITKSMWKKTLKIKLEEVIREVVKEKKKTMKKLRFINDFKKQEYLSKYSMAVVSKIMNIRLNMVEVAGNFKRKDEDERCRACREEKETTEHVIECEEYKKLTGHEIVVYEGCFQDMKWLKKATEVFKIIESTRNVINRCI